MTKQAETHAIELRAYEATVQNLEQRIRELEALMVPGRFPSDVMTAAGLVYHGKRDKVLAERLRIGAQSMLAALSEAAQVPKQDLSVCQYTAPKRIHLCVSDDEADHNRAFCDGFEPHDVTWAEDAPIAVCVEYVRADLAAAQVPVMGEAFQLDNLCSPPLAVIGSPVAWTSPEWLRENGRLHGSTRPHPSFKVPLYRAPATSITAQELEWLLDTAQAYGEQMCKSEDIRTVDKIRTAMQERKE